MLVAAGDKGKGGGASGHLLAFYVVWTRLEEEDFVAGVRRRKKPE